MQTLAHPDLEDAPIPDLQLLRETPRDEPERWRRAMGISLAGHAVLVVALALLPESSVAPAVERPVIARRVTPLVAPRFELTQKAPNKGPLSKDLSAESILPSPKVQSPAPAARRMAPPPPAPMRVAKSAPVPALPEPPKMDAGAKPVPSLPPIAMAQTPPQIQASEKPKIVLETPGAPPPVMPKGTGRLALPNSSIDEAVRDLAHGGSKGGTSVGDSVDLGGAGPGLNLPPSAGRPKSQLELKSDPMGVDFHPYLLQVLATVRRNWFAVYPESAKLGQRGKVTVQFSIGKDGRIRKVVFTSESGARALDRAAVAALSASDPLPSLPGEFHGDQVVLQFTFLYNIQTN